MDQIRQNLPAKSGSVPLTTALKSLLETGGNDEAVQAILERPDLRQEAIAALPALEREARREAGPEGVRAVIGRRFAIYPPMNMPEAQWTAWWADYFEVCADLSMAALEAGMLDWVRDPQSKFMPKPGELRERSRRVQNKAALAVYRARHVANCRDPAPTMNPHHVLPPQTRKVLSPEDRSSVAKGMDDFRSRIKHGDPIRAPVPNTAGKPDQGGLTPQMRKLMGVSDEDAAEAAVAEHWSGGDC